VKRLAAILCALSVAAAANAAPTKRAPPPDVNTYIPEQAVQHLPTLSKQVKEVWPTFYAPNYFGALIEHESCISLTHSKCWNPTSRLKSDREEGAGLGQLTRAFKADGSTRFDALEDAKRLDAKGLNDLRWDTVYQRPDLQMRVVILMTRANWNRLDKLVADNDGKLAMTDAAYNGGIGGVLNERRACGLREGCDPNKWFGHVEKVCLKSTKPLYAGRSACDINRHHVHDVLHTRMPKYKGKI
jgi:hypothetical protein